jgi:hypothetical protein
MLNNRLQAMTDGLSLQWQKERAETQLTLGTLIDKLKVMDPNEPVPMLYAPHSYRGYYIDLAFEWNQNVTQPASTLLELCKSCMGEIFDGYKGGEFQMGRNTPLWAASWGAIGDKIIDLNGPVMLIEPDIY